MLVSTNNIIYLSLNIVENSRSLRELSEKWPYKYYEKKKICRAIDRMKVPKVSTVLHESLKTPVVAKAPECQCGSRRESREIDILMWKLDGTK